MRIVIDVDDQGSPTRTVTTTDTVQAEPQTAEAAAVLDAGPPPAALVREIEDLYHAAGLAGTQLHGPVAAEEPTDAGAGPGGHPSSDGAGK